MARRKIDRFVVPREAIRDGAEALQSSTILGKGYIRFPNAVAAVVITALIEHGWKLVAPTTEERADWDRWRAEQDAALDATEVPK